MKFTPNGTQVWITQSRSNELVIFAAAQRHVIRHIPTGRFSKGLLILPDGDHGFVSAMEENEVVEVDVVTGRVVQRMRTGTAPEGLAWISHSQTTESQTRLRRQSGQVLINGLPKKRTLRIHAGGPIVGRWNLEISFKLGDCE